MPVTHYENFPVASVLLPRHLRRPIEAIYWFARSADDLADEGDHSPAWRLAAIDAYRRELDAIAASRPVADAHWERLREVIVVHRLPLALFRDLLDAFAQDVVQPRYADFAPSPIIAGAPPIRSAACCSTCSVTPASQIGRAHV